MTSNERRNITIKDTGLTLLTNPHNATADLVFVHGLQGHPENTWTYRPPRDRWEYLRLPWTKANGENTTKVYWPLDLLSKEPGLEDTRIMTFGYDSIVIRSFRKNKGHNILHHANELIASLHRERANDPKRPLVFIAHSLGGIVVKIMLKTSDDQPTYQDLIKSTGGVIFLGTPHRGSTAADRGLLVANLARFAFLKSNDRILRALRAESDILESYRDSFNHLLHKVQLHVYSFYETERMLNIPGINSMIVPYESAVIGDILYETRQSTQKNHSEICKFAEVEDDVYKSVSFAIKECLIRKQGNKATVNEPAVLYISNLELPETGEYYIPLISTNISTELDWIFKDPEFREWESTPSSKILWLGANPGSLCWKQGGPLLVKRLQERKELYLYLPCTDSMGFGLRREPKEVSLMAARMLIRLVVDFDPNTKVLEQAIERFLLSQNALPPPKIMGPKFWTLERLFEILFYSLLAVFKPRLYIIVDGLDALGSESYLFISQLNRLYNQSIVHEKVTIKIFFITQPRLFQSPLNYMEEEMATIPYIYEDKEQKDCLQSLRTVDFAARPNVIFSADPSTGRWLWENASFNKWAAYGSSSLLVIEGKPGSGKSTLAKQIVQEKDKLFGLEKHNQETLLGYFFYSSRGGPTEKSHETMLESVLWQLLSAEPRLYPIFKDKFRAQRSQVGLSSHWSFDDLRDVFISLTTIDIELLIFIVLDAMDESDHDDEERKLFDIIDTMQKVCSSTSKCTIKVLMTSRPLKKLTHARGFPCLILEEYNRGDIEMIIDETMEKITKQLRSESNENDGGIGGNELDGVKKYVKEHADGVFLWVDLVLRKIKALVETGFSDAELMQPQTFLPLELTGLYGQIIDRLSKNSKEDIAEGRRFISIAMFALRRLTLSEVKDAIIIPSITESDVFVMPKDINRHRVRLLRNRIAARCGDLIEIKAPLVQLVHESVRDFLQRESAGPFIMHDQDGKDGMLSVCVRYLRISITRDTISNKRVKDWSEEEYVEFAMLLKNRPFLGYVISFLPSHLKLTRASRALEEWEQYRDEVLSLEPAYFFLGSSLISEDRLSKDERMMVNSFLTKALLVAAKSGILEAIRLLTTAGAKLDSVEEETGASPLSLAVTEGQMEATKLLINLGFDTDHKDRRGETPLHRAIIRGSEDLVEELLRNGASKYTSNLLGEEPLHLAVTYGHENIVALLLRLGAQVNSQDQYGRTALHRAVAAGHFGIATRLLDARANRSADAYYIGTPLHVAVDRNDIVMVRLLVEKQSSHGQYNLIYGASYGGTALHSAAMAGDKEIVGVLLKAFGTSILNYIDRYGLRPADYARENGHTEIEQMLLPKAN